MDTKELVPKMVLLKLKLLVLVLFLGTSYGVAQTTWYTLASGDWDESDIWTLDPAGAIPVGSVGASGPTGTDNVVILSGKTVTVPDGVDPYDGDPEPARNLSLNCASVTIYGSLDLRTASGHTFSSLKGTGRLLMAADNYPTITDDSDFIGKGAGEGTVVYYGNSFTVTNARTYYNLEIEASANIVTLANDHTLNGNLIVKEGTLQINNTSTGVVTLDVTGNVNVLADGQMTVGAGDTYSTHAQYHQFKIGGNFINAGSAEFTNRLAAVYDTDDTGGAVEVIFNNASSDQELQCNGPTVFNQLTCNKGSDATFILEVSASSTDNFKLYGRNDQNSTGDSGDRDGNQALRLLAGTLKLSSNIVIEELADDHSFDIDSDACLWLDNNASATLRGDDIYLYGELRLSGNSTFYEKSGTSPNGSSQRGLKLRERGVLNIEGGTHEFNAITVSTSGTPGEQIGAYIQSGGDVSVLQERSGGTAASFHLPFQTNVFQMSGGTLTIEDDGDNEGGEDFTLIINSGEGNYNVTGGTVILSNKHSYAHKINSRAPFWNLTIENQQAGGSIEIAEYAMTGINGDNDFEDISAQPLVVINDFTIDDANAPTFTANSNDVYIGGDFIIESGATYTPGSNTTYFNGDQNSTIQIESVSDVFSLNKLLIEKDDNTLGVNIIASNFTGDHPVEIADSLIVTRGQFDVVSYEVDLKGNIVIEDGIVEASGATPGLIVLNNASSQQTLKGSNIYNSSFGRIELDNSNGASLNSDVEMDYLELTSGIMHIGTRKLTVNVNYIAGTGFGTGKMIETDANHGAKGLTLKMDDDYSAGKTVIFPVGTNGEWTKCDVDIAGSVGSVADGYLTVAPINLAHPTAKTGGGCSNLDLYWNVTETGLSSVTSGVSYTFNNPLGSPGGGSKEVYSLSGSSGWTEDGNASGTLVYETGTLNGFKTGSFTAGKNACFNDVSATNSVKSGPWIDPATWDNGVPQSYDYVYIKNGHTVTVNSSADDAGKVTVEEGGTLDIGAVTGLTYNIVEGAGTIRIASATIPSADFDNFMYNDLATFEYYGSTNMSLPGDFDVYPNLLISGTNRKLLPDGMGILVRKNFYIDGDVTVRTRNNQYLLIENNLIITNGGLLEINRGGSHEITVYNSIDLSGAGANEILVRDGTGNTQVSKLNVYEDIVLSASSKIDLWSDIDKPVELHFVGDQNSTIDNTVGATLDFSKIVVNKSASTGEVYLQGAFNLNSPADVAEKPIHLLKGVCHLEGSGAQTISTGSFDFNIPSGTTLKVDNGTILNVSGNDKGIWLDGSLIIEEGGIVNNNGGTNNYIEYSSSGDATITLNGSASLKVGSQIRRSLFTNTGILKFAQNSATSTMLVGDTDAGDQSRGIFEILGTGSSFTQAVNAQIIIERGHGVNNAALYFNPETITLNAGSAFVLGNDETPASNTMAIYALQEMENLTVTGVNSPTALLLYSSATINGDLNINSGTFNANGIDLIINGDFTKDASATFTANSNTTYFQGDVDQTLTGSPVFANVVKQTGSGTLILSSSWPTVTGDLTLSSGAFNTTDNSIAVQGDLTNDVTTMSTAGSQGIILSGSDVQQIGGSGSYEVLTINNTNGVVLPTQSGALNIGGSLRLQDGIFDIGRNLIVFDEDADVVPVSAFSATNMIQTNLSFTDNGIQKYFPEITSGTTSFTYPIGSLGKYTPVVMDITANGTNTGSIRVKAADEPHVSIPVNDQGEVLQYNWTLDADGISGFTADVYMYSYDDDAVGDTSAYYTARILLGSVNWNKYSTNEFMGYADATDISKFTFSGTNDDGIDGDYTAGGAIPDEVQAFISVTDGSWTTTTTWATYDPDTGVTGSAGDGVPAGTGPKGAIVYIDNGDEVTMSDNFMSAYRTVIRETGVLTAGSSYGHRIGDVLGQGTLKLQNGDLPAGSYDEFFSSAGGTLEYAGSTSYDVLSEIPLINNVVFSGSGTRRLPNIDVQLYGDLTINGPDVDNTYNTNMSIQGDVVFDSGTYDAGVESSPKVPTVTFNGTALQSVSGLVDFISAGGGAFYNLKIDNAAGLTLGSNVEVSNDLYLTNGVIKTSGTELLSVSNSANDAVIGGSSVSFVEGAMQKQVLNSASFSFPLGYGAIYAPIDVSVDASSGGLWEAEYLGINPVSYATRPMDPETVSSPVQYVSHSEFWRVKAPVASYNAQLTLYWDTHSGVNPDGNFTLVDWQSTTPSWEQVTYTGLSGDTNSGSVSTSGDVTFNEWASEGNYITFGSITIPAYTWEGDVSSDWFTPGNWSGNIVPGAGSNVTVVTGVSSAEIDGIAQVNDLTITSGTLTVKEGSRFTINGDLTGIDNGLIIENSNASPTSFINYGSATPEVTFKWSLDELKYWYISHSVTGVTMSEYDNSFAAPNDYFLYEWTTVWNNITKSAGYSFNEPLGGYVLNPKDPGSQLTYAGVVNSDASYGLTNMAAQWHLVGNPYPAYIDMLEENVDLGNFLQSIWVRTDVGVDQRGYATYNLLSRIGQNGGDRYVAPGQSIWLRTYTTNDAISIPSSARLHATGSLKGSVIEEDVLRLTLESDYSRDEMVLAIRENSSEVMTAYDSDKKLAGGNVANLYSIKNGTKAAINAIPTLGERRVIPVGYKTVLNGMSQFTLRVGDLSYFAPESSVLLVDKVLGNTINLREEQEYVFMPETISSDERFELIFESISTDTKDVDISEKAIKIYAVNDMAYVVLNNFNAAYDAVIEVYDLKGALEQQVNVTSSKTEIKLPKSGAVYIINVKIGGRSYSQKVESF
ncbi:T9SS type A sorting domain-containing protein [Labilibacter sediminis]|nr:T9SS type A sorting domain-containing protein [Labilibacter sediminis]